MLGGVEGLAAWSALQLVPPALGALVLLITLVTAAWRRTWQLRHTVGVVCGLVSMVPLGIGFGLVPLYYPGPIEGPELAIRVPMNEEVLVFWGGTTAETNYHVISPDQRRA